MSCPLPCNTRRILQPIPSFFAEEIEFGHSYRLVDKAVHDARIVYLREARHKLKRLIADTRPTLAHAHNVYHHIAPAIFPLLKAEGNPDGHARA
jgi:hypothetical protein